jgi:hypothetical protein
MSGAILPLPNTLPWHCAQLKHKGNFVHGCLSNICCVGPSHHCMARPWVADEGDALQIWRVAANILNKSRTADKRWSTRLGIVKGSNNSSL